MKTVEIHLDDQTFVKAQQFASFHQCTLEDLIKDIIEQLGISEPIEDNIIGMFADEPELLDEIVESAMLAREKINQAMNLQIGG